MKYIPIVLILFWIIVVISPDIIAYLIWGFLIFIGVNMLMMSSGFGTTKWGKKDYIKFGDYKIYRNKK